MKKDQSQDIILLIAIFVGIFAIIILIFSPFNFESYTELYFEDHESLPYEVKISETYKFQFTINNLESETQNYTYLSLIVLDGEQKFIGEDTLSLENNEKVTMEVEFTLTEAFDSGKVIVTLDNQEIYFWITMEDE